MRPKELLESYRGTMFEDADGYQYEMELRPGLSPADIRAFEEQLPGPLSEGIRELLAYSSGIDGLVFDTIDFRGRLEFEYRDVFPAGLPIASDGTGNFVVLDVHPDAVEWGAVYFACHDPPVITFVAQNLSGFLDASLSFDRGLPVDEDNPVRRATGEGAFDVWRDEPDMMSRRRAHASDDPTLSEFAAALDDRFDVCDLRQAQPGQGFAWGRAGPDTEVIRCGTAPIFAVEQKGWLRRLLGL